MEMWRHIGCIKGKQGLIFFLLCVSVFGVKLLIKETKSNITYFCCSPLVPLPQVVYGNLPLWFKTTFLFEFPLYNRNLPQESLNW